MIDRPGRHTFVSGLQVLLADGLYLPTALILTVFVTRALGPSAYGRFILAATTVTWIELSLVSLLSRPAVRLVATAGDWKPAGAMILRAALLVGLPAGATLWLASAPLARLLGDPALGPILRIFAIDVPLFATATAHRFVLVGRGRFSSRATAAAARWMVRLALVLVLVLAGFGVAGVVVGTIGASLAEIVVARRFVRVPLSAPGPFPWRELARLAAPLGVSGISLRVFDRLDLFMLQIILVQTSVAGVYGAALNLAQLPLLAAGSFMPVLLSTLTRVQAESGPEAARGLARSALGAALWLAPPAAAVAGASAEVVLWLFGPRYVAAAPALTLLTAASFARVLMRLSSTLLVAADRPRLTAVVAVPLLPAALAADLWLIPRFGSLGAAGVSASLAAAGALVALALTRMVWKIVPAPASLARAAVLAAGAWMLARYVPAAGLFVPLKLVAIAGVAALGLKLTGEI